MIWTRSVANQMVPGSLFCFHVNGQVSFMFTLSITSSGSEDQEFDLGGRHALSRRWMFGRSDANVEMFPMLLPFYVYNRWGIWSRFSRNNLIWSSLFCMVVVWKTAYICAFADVVLFVQQNISSARKMQHEISAEGCRTMGFKHPQWPRKLHSKYCKSNKYRENFTAACKRQRQWSGSHIFKTNHYKNTNTARTKEK